jgi:hypothetical protein
VVNPRALTLVIAAVLALPAEGAAQTAEERAAARGVAERRGPAVVMVLATVKTRMAQGSRETTRDVAVQTNGTVIDTDGLTVLALSSIEPGSLLSARGRGAVTTDTADLRIRTADDRELPARIVLRDADLDLLFVRPVDAAGAPLTAADGPTAEPALMDLLVALQRTSENSGWRTFASFAYVQMVVDRPQPFFVVSTGGFFAGALGFPFFDIQGRFIGIMARVGGPRTNPLPAIVPADDIRAIAKQAMGR